MTYKSAQRRVDDFMEGWFCGTSGKEFSADNKGGLEYLLGYREGLAVLDNALYRARRRYGAKIYGQPRVWLDRVKKSFYLWYHRRGACKDCESPCDEETKK